MVGTALLRNDLPNDNIDTQNLNHDNWAKERTEVRQDSCMIHDNFQVFLLSSILATIGFRKTLSDRTDKLRRKKKLYGNVSNPHDVLFLPTF